MTSIWHMQDLEIGLEFWERVDHAVRMSMAAAFNGTVLFFSGQSLMPIRFMGLAPLIAFEALEQTTGACLLIIPLLWRAQIVGSAFGIVGAVIFRQMTRTVYLSLFPFVSGLTALMVVSTSWIPQYLNGLTTLVALFSFAYAPDDLAFTPQFLLTLTFGVSTSVLFKVMPLPGYNGSFQMGPILATTKAEGMINKGREMSSSVIQLLVETETENYSNHARHHLASTRALLLNFEQLLPKLEALQKAASTEISLLFLCSTRSMEQIDKWIQFFRAMLPTLRLLHSLVSAKQEAKKHQRSNNDAGEDPLEKSFSRFTSASLHQLAQALSRALLCDDTKNVEPLLQHAERAHFDLQTALSNHRFNLFYNKHMRLDEDSAKWESFVRGVALVHSMVRLTALIIPHAHDRLTTSTTSSNISKEPFLSPLWRWCKSMLAVIFAHISFQKPFTVDSKEGRLYAMSFCLQIALATLWFAIPELDERMNDEGLFVSVTTSFIMIGKFGRSFQKSIQRIFGTSIASAFAMFVVVTLRLSPDPAINATYPYVLGCLLAIDRDKPYPMQVAAFTAFIFLFRDEPFDTQEEFLLNVTFRIATVGVGIFQFILIEMLLFRSSARTRLEEQCKEYFSLLDALLEEFSQLSLKLDEEAVTEESTHTQLLTQIRSSLEVCKAFTADAQDNFEAAIGEPGARINVKPAFAANQYRQLLSLQSQSNTLLSQIFEAFAEVTNAPVKDPTKWQYREELRILHGMVTCLAGTVKQVANAIPRDGEPKSQLAWLKEVRRFENSAMDQKDVLRTGFDRLQQRSVEVDAKDHREMVEQSFVMRLCVVSWSTVEICFQLQEMSHCFESISASRADMLFIKKSLNDSQQTLEGESPTIQAEAEGPRPPNG